MVICEAIEHIAVDMEVMAGGEVMELFVHCAAEDAYFDCSCNALGIQIFSVSDGVSFILAHFVSP